MIAQRLTRATPVLRPCMGLRPAVRAVCAKRAFATRAAPEQQSSAQEGGAQASDAEGTSLSQLFGSVVPLLFVGFFLYLCGINGYSMVRGREG